MDDLKTLDTSRLTRLDLDRLGALDTARLAAPWGETYSTATYGQELDANAVIKAQNHVKTLIDATGARSFADALGALPAPGESVHAIIGFRHSMGDLLPAVARLSGQRIEVCHIATLTYSRQNATDWAAMLDAGTIRKLSVLVSHYFSKTSPQIFDATAPMLRARGVTIAAARSHAKLLLCKLADGRCITGEGSANTRSAKTVEQLTIFGDPAIYSFHRQWLDKIIADTNDASTTPRQSSPRRTAYSQKRAALGVWASTIADEDRADAIAWKTTAPPDTATTARYAAAVVETIRQWSPVLPPGAVVTVPPQGASAPGHYFAQGLARAVAGLLGVPFVVLLARTDTKVYHHPRESMRQAPYRTASTPPATVIVVDDLITSGTTMRLSLDALRQAGTAAFGFAFCGC
ncbi:MAG: phosphoribosyltransferase [Tepidisphaerales bacterium]